MFQPKDTEPKPIENERKVFAASMRMLDMAQQKLSCTIARRVNPKEAEKILNCSQKITASIREVIG